MQVQSYLKCHTKKCSAFPFCCQFNSRYQSKCDSFVWASTVYDTGLSMCLFSTCWPTFLTFHENSHIFRVSSFNNSPQYFIHSETKTVSLRDNTDPLPSPKINDYFKLFFLILALDGSKSAILNTSSNTDKYTEKSEAGERLSL